MRMKEELTYLYAITIATPVVPHCRKTTTNPAMMQSWIKSAEARACIEKSCRSSWDAEMYRDICFGVP